MNPVSAFLLLSGPSTLSRAIISELEAELMEFTAELPAQVEAELPAPVETELPPTPEAETC
jgi:hypothetical protein